MGFNNVQSRLAGDEHLQKITFVTDDNLVMTAAMNVVEVVLTSTNTGTVTLPPVAEAAGQIYVIRAVDAGGGCTVADNAADAGFADVALDADGESMVVLSDGKYWNELQANYAA